MFVDTVSLHFVPQPLSTLKCFLDSYSLVARTQESTLVHRHWTGSWAMNGTRWADFLVDIKSYLHWRSDCWSSVCLQASVSVWLESWSHTCSWQHRKYIASWITSYWRKCFPFQGKRSSSIFFCLNSVTFQRMMKFIHLDPPMGSAHLFLLRWIILYYTLHQSRIPRGFRVQLSIEMFL